MSTELGHFAFVLASVLALARLWSVVWAFRTSEHTFGFSIVQRLTFAETLLVSFAFMSVCLAFVGSDFSLKLAFEHSHTLKPLIYKISGVWGNHEGSMLLWALILSLTSAAHAAFGNKQDVRENLVLHGSQASLSLGFFAFIIFTSNPFLRLSPAPLEGQDLNPVLQDIGLALHPPLLYIGYVGFSLAFSFAIAALILGQVSASWASRLKTWSLIAWLFLTLGIALGSYWAYYELGWGGFWFWDPVENASLVPWLLGTALIHSIAVLQKREALKIWTVLLALMTFIASLLGTFLVRSGVLNSVHAFANDPERGVFILALLSLYSCFGFALFAWRFSSLSQGKPFHPLSREAALVFNNLFLTAAALTVFVGTLYPLVLEALTDRKITVGAPFFNATTVPLMLPLALLMPFGQRVPWKRGNVWPLFSVLWPAVFVSIVMLAFICWLYGVNSPSIILGLWLGTYLVCASLADLFEQKGEGGVFGRLLRTPVKCHATAIAHAGFGLSIIGIVCSLLSTETLNYMGQNDEMRAGHTKIILHTLNSQSLGNYDQLDATFEVYVDGVSQGNMTASRRLYKTRQMPTTEVGLLTRGFSQVYITLGEILDNKISVRLQEKPLVLLIWIGALVMALGGALAALPKSKRAALNAVLAMGLMFGASNAYAISPQEQFADKALEQRARGLFELYRCVVCQNQSLSDSNAEIAQDMRAVIREKISDGASDADIRQYLVSRYGDFVLLSPPKDEGTLLLWLAPALIVLGGAFFARKLFVLKEPPQ